MQNHAKGKLSIEPFLGTAIKSLAENHPLRWAFLMFAKTLGFQTPCEEVIGPQKPTPNAKPQQVYGRLGKVPNKNSPNRDCLMVR